MPRIEDRLKLLDRVPPPVAAGILLEALRYAEVRERQSLARQLLETRRDDAVAAVIGMLQELPETLVADLLAIGPGLVAPLREVCREGRTARILNCLDVVARSAEPATLDLAVDLLSVANEPVANRAGEVLGAVARQHLGPAGAWRDPEAGAVVEAALARAADTITTHGDQEVLFALACALPAACGALHGLLGQDDHPAVLALRRIPEHVDHPAVGASLLRWLGHPVLGRPTGRWVHQVTAQRLWATVGASWHLLLAPHRRRALRLIAEPRRCLLDPIEHRDLPHAVEAGLPRLMAGLRLPVREIESAWIGLSAALNPSTRAHAIVGLASQSRRAEGLVPFLDDAVPAVAHLAATTGARATGDRTFGAEALAANPTDRIARRGRRMLARRSIPDLMTVWDHIDAGSRHAAARTYLDRDRRGLVQALETSMFGDGRDRRCEAIALVRRLGLAGDVVETLARLAHDPSPRIVAAAIAALGDLQGIERHAGIRHRAVTHALRHADPRVRATGIEVGGHDDDAAWERLLVLIAHHDENRPRANAIRAMLGRDPDHGRTLLGTMLVDPKPLHRVSALWVARIARVIEARPDIERLARADPLPVVRTRARSVLKIIGGDRGRRQLVGNQP
ncbi:MAG: hypothetical protein ACYTGR_14490 [Planctomycetota bacterium]|jgi:hypothetical protein